MPTNKATPRLWALPPIYWVHIVCQYCRGVLGSGTAQCGHGEEIGACDDPECATKAKRDARASMHKKGIVLPMDIADHIIFSLLCITKSCFLDFRE